MACLADIACPGRVYGFKCKNLVISTRASGYAYRDRSDVIGYIARDTHQCLHDIPPNCDALPYVDPFLVLLKVKAAGFTDFLLHNITSPWFRQRICRILAEIC